MTDLTKLDAANAALQAQATMAKTTKAFSQATTDAIHSIDARVSKLEGAVTPPPVDPPPSTDMLWPLPTLRSPVTLIIPAGTNTVRVSAGMDAIIDCQWIERKTSVLIFGSAGSRILVKNYWANINVPIADESPYWRGGPRVRSDDGIGPDEVYILGCLVQGGTLADAFAVAAGSNTVVTLGNTRLECARMTTGQSTPEPSEHIDQAQVQGKVAKLRLGQCSVFPSDTKDPIDPGKGIMANLIGVSALEIDVKYTNFVSVGRTGAVVFQGDPAIAVNFGEGVYADQSKTTGNAKWADGSSMFYPYGFKSSGTAPNRTITFTNPGYTGKVLEGVPAGGDYVTRAVKP